MTDIHRGFPYQWPGDTPAEKLRLYREKIAKQVEQVLHARPKYQDNIVFVPFNEPEATCSAPASGATTGQLADRPARLLRRLGRGLPTSSRA